MKALGAFLRLSGGTILAGGVLLILLQGCKFIEVKVKTKCPPSGLTTIIDEPPGGCNPPINWTGNSAVSFWDTETLTQIPEGSDATCSAPGSTKCPSPAGYCGFGKPCKSWYRASTSFCFCGCNPS